MFKKNVMVKGSKAVRNAIEATYIGLCDIYEFEKTRNLDGSTAFGETLVQSAVPCRLSKESLNAATKGDVAKISQSVKILLAPEVQILAGSKIVISQNGNVETYKRSGEPFVYSSHQEVMLELFDEFV